MLILRSCAAAGTASVKNRKLVRRTRIRSNILRPSQLKVQQAAEKLGMLRHARHERKHLDPSPFVPSSVAGLQDLAAISFDSKTQPETRTFIFPARTANCRGSSSKARARSAGGFLRRHEPGRRGRGRGSRSSWTSASECPYPAKSPRSRR